MSPDDKKLTKEQLEERMATEADTLEFCNRVRDAGGANALKALLPSEPQNSLTCLIAGGLNFHCAVSPYESVRNSFFHADTLTELGYPHKSNVGPDECCVWVMKVRSRALADKIGSVLGLPVEDSRYGTGEFPAIVVLPYKIGMVAETFDDAGEGDGAAPETWVAKYIHPSYARSV